MSKFDTHGGYFAPKDYLRVNEGGSHEENPNGGVQIGVDPEGAPNLLEEGEPVYKDYVYSDNIEAEKEFLEQNNLPTKYAGKLYSKIADDLFSEAEERPLDPISRNGLEALLGRLADAQEGQKQAKEQRELEDELANLSPEELDQLEAMLAQGEQPINGVDAGAVGLAGPEVPEGIVQAPAEPMPVEGMPIMRNGGCVNRFDNGGWSDFLDLVRGYHQSNRAGGIDKTYSIDPRFAYLRGNKDIYALEQSDPYVAFTNYIKNNSNDPNVRAYLRLLDQNTGGTADKLFLDENTLRDNWFDLYNKRRNDQVAGIYHLNPEDIGFLTAPTESAGTAQGPQSVAALSRISGPLYDFPTGTGYIPEGANLGLPNFTLQAPTSPSYGNSLGYPHGVLYDIDTNTGYRPKDASLGLSDFKLHVPQSVLEADMRFRMGRGDTRPFNDVYENTVVDFAGKAPVSGSDDSTDINAGISSGPLPVWPRYAGAIGSGLLGLYNAFQSPDRYTATRINPRVPEGRINLQNQVYNPIDQNMIANAQIAQGNATNRALRNSGLGASAASAILAADNNTTGNLGTGFIQAWDANNQRRNAVVAANNQAEAQRAQFDYTVDAARKDAINRVAPYNAQNNLMIQRLNNQAEADKYTAISNQISNGLQALSGIGQENFAMNQVNSNPAFLGYRVAPDGTMRYMPWYNCNGGFLKKFKK